ncbi:MAG TPA: hypothetical protein VEO01_35480 [Pseudonocardiaceae bacterium]|nr:hypothetical protein [Pseudonocardiaceae bacterium]
MTDPTGNTDAASPVAAAPMERRGGPQPGILNRPPEHLVFAALAFAGERSPDVTRQTIEQLRTLLSRELRSDIDNLTADADKSQPYPETGELGFSDGFDRAHLTVTTGFSRNGLEALGVPVDLMPGDLVTIPWTSPTPATSPCRSAPTTPTLPNTCYAVWSTPWPVVSQRCTP